MARRRNQSIDSRVPLLVVAGVVGYFLLRKANEGSPVSGFGKSLKKLAKGVTKHSIVGKIVKKVAPRSVKRVLAKLDPTKHTQRPAPRPASAEEVVEYQDENGNPISEGEYNRRVAEMNAANASPAVAPAQPQTFIKHASHDRSHARPAFPQMPSNAELMRQQFALQAAQSAGQSFSAGPSGGGLLMPPPEATPAPSAFGPEAAPAPKKKMNPIMAIAAFAAVPIVMGLTGGK